jgi:polysaccharide deacetylase family protein (PEP-CTERM system associated)
MGSRFLGRVVDQPDDRVNVMNALTIDVEDYFQVHAFETTISRSDWDRYSVRVIKNTQRVLNVLSDCNVKATFFFLGWIADAYPELVRSVADGGHEIATHGYWHELVYRQSPEEFEIDLKKSLDAIQRAVACTVLGYRAPAFSITNKSLWALDILQRHGLRYDSSIFPLAAHDRYGIPNAQRFAHRTDAGMWEFPISTIRLNRWNLPVAGGGYFRLYPTWLTRWAIRKINAEGQPAIIYLHPWEFDPEQPRIQNVSALSKFRHYVNLRQTEKRLRNLLQEFRFGPIREVFNESLAIESGGTN